MDNYLSGIVEQDIYEETDVSLKTDLSNAKAKFGVFQQQADEEVRCKKGLQTLRKHCLIMRYWKNLTEAYSRV